MNHENESKSELKRQAKKIEQIATNLVQLKQSQLAKLKLEKGLLDAIESYNRASSRVGKKRSIQFIAKIIRKTNAETLETKLVRITENTILDKRDLKQLEAWRIKLISDNSAIREYMEKHPDTKHQTLRQKVLKARAAIATDREKAESSQLLRFLREETERQAE